LALLSSPGVNQRYHDKTMMRFLMLRPAVKRNDGIELLDRRVTVGLKQIGERVQYRIDDAHHGQSWPKTLKA
jgi:hypothetical protein